MTDQAPRLAHSVLVHPPEDSTADNLRGLAELLDLCDAAHLDVRITPRAVVGPENHRTRFYLGLAAAGRLEDLCAVARGASARAIYPDLRVRCGAERARASLLLTDTTGVLLRPA